MAESLLQKGHARSVSAGGITSQNNTRPSALRKGHQRAFSHGQISSEDVGFVKGHNRIGSKTDFILPPGHRETSGGKGHSREGSRSESVYTLRTNAPPSWIERLLTRALGNKRGEETRGGRSVVPNHLVPPRMPRSSHPNGSAPGNQIRTTKYTLLSFLPKNLLEQFHRVANLYFIFIVLLNWVPSINAFGKEIAMIPVMFVLGVTGIKDLFEDRRRRASDKRINNSTCRVYNGEEERYKRVRWSEVRVGDIVHLSNNEVLPADVLLLRSSDEHGTCYLDTSDLDGETNLKQRSVPQGYVEKQECFIPSGFRNVVEVDPPTTKLYHFHGAIVEPTGARTPVSTPHLLLRDSVIKNTDFVEGIVVYTGHETKAMLNNSGARYKRSSLEKRMNVDVMWCVAILVALCSFGSIGCKLWLGSLLSRVVHKPPFIITDNSATYEAWLTFWTFIIILQVMIPLSLYVTIEMTKLLQVYHINNNIDLYDPETNRRMECRALNITEQLGQIQYIFSDKTGTLTENKMVFRRCTINGIDYNHPAGKILPGLNNGINTEVLPNSKLLEIFLDSESSQKNHAKDFLIALALCNTVVVATHPHHDIMNASGIIEGLRREESSESGLGSRYRRLVEDRSVTPSPTTPLEEPFVPSQHNPRVGGRTGAEATLSPISSSTESSPTLQAKQSPSRPKLLNVPNMFFSRKQTSKNGMSPKSRGRKPIFEAESPDELALVQMVYAYNCRLLKRTPLKAILSLPGERIAEYQILRVLPFDSSRKCMSVVVRAPDTHEIVVYCKGADSAIFPRLANPSAESATEGQVEWYSSQGLRVLVIGRRTLGESKWGELAATLDAAEASCSPANIRQAYATVETSLTLLGATGIEDRLQAGVSDTMGALRAAGVVVWVLTGDKTETAVNVAVSAGLFTPAMETFRLTARSKQSAEAAIAFYSAEIHRTKLGLNESGTSSERLASKGNRQKALIVDGKTLTYILDRRSNLTKPFLELTQHCTAVLCCRVTPLQKGYIVRVVKEQLKMRTLAIGDGANDVSMIQAADVGIGISGQEGMQAVMASDFSLAKFRFLHRLLLVHGHWAYHRLANMVLYFFYKNATFVFLIFWYQIYCGFSGTVMIDQMYHMLYNLFFTSLPPLAIGVYDQDAPESLLLSRPYLYSLGRLGVAYKTHLFWLTTVDALYQSVAIFYISVAAYADTEIGIWEFGTTITSSCMFAMLLQVALEARSWTIVHLASLGVSLGAFYLFCIVYNSVCMQCWGLPSNTWVVQTTLGDPSYWLIILLSTVTALLPRFLVRGVGSMYWPDDVMRAVLETRQAQQRGDNFLVSWSRSTSTSSIYRATDSSNKTSNPSTLTAVG